MFFILYFFLLDVSLEETHVKIQIHDLLPDQQYIRWTLNYQAKYIRKIIKDKPIKKEANKMKQQTPGKLEEEKDEEEKRRKRMRSSNCTEIKFVNKNICCFIIFKIKSIFMLYLRNTTHSVCPCDALMPS